MLAMTANSMLTTVAITTTVPLYFREHFTSKLLGFFDLDAIIFFPVIAAIIMICGAINTDLLLLILINRYDIVSNTVAPKPRYIINTVYACMIVTSLIQYYNLLHLLFNLSQPSLFTEIIDKTRFLYLPLTIFYHVSRSISFVVIIWLNVRFGRRYMIHSSAAAVRLHKMLTRATLANVICETVVSRIPMLIIVISIILKDQNLQVISINLTMALQSCAFLANMVTTMLFVKPYRVFLKKLFESIHENFTFVS
uniref:G protein-coupled receptor n=1 Tax=Panagrellus redivivus TaxID=6233 RepID=A0A7E4VH50_PANRE